MRKSAFHILRVGVAITFLWIGILIFKEPEAWGGYIKPEFAEFLPFSLGTTMIGTAVFDVLIGILLLIDYATWLPAILASVHLIIVLTVAGIDAITVRDIGLLAGTLALFADSLPKNLFKKQIK